MCKDPASVYRRTKHWNTLCSGGTALLRILICTLGPIVFLPIAFAQSHTATLVGIVSGPDDERLAGVQVHLSSRDSPLPISETTTDKEGRFEYVGLAPGTYTAELSLSGWHNNRLSRLELRPATTLDVNIVLSPVTSSLESSPSVQTLDRGVWWGMRFDKESNRELPYARNVWSLLESQETSTVTDRLDVGGLETGRPALFSALGASWTENLYDLNRFNVTDPYLPGLPLTNPDVDALTGITAVTAAKPAIFAGSGVNLILDTDQQPTRFHGATRWFFSNHALQSDNTDARLARLGFPGPERLNHLVDGSFQVGGKLPLNRTPWPFFIALSTQQVSKDLGGFAAPIDAHVYRILARVAPFSGGKRQLNLLYAGQHILNTREGAEPRIDPSSTARGNDNFHQFQARWRNFSSASTLFDIGFGVAHGIISSGIQPGVVGTSTIDLPERSRSGPAALSSAGVRTRYEANLFFQTVREASPSGSHSLSFGVAFDRSNITNRWDASGGIEQILVNGAGVELIKWNTPTRTQQHVQNVTIFAQDAWRPLKWLSVPIGLRFESSTGSATGVSNRIRWTTVEPHVGLVIPLRSSGPVLRASWSRYSHVLQGRYFDFGNPAAVGGQVFRWQDTNGDLQVQPQEIGQLLRVFGGPFSAVDRKLRRPFTDEISLGLERQFGQHLQARARFFRRDTHRLIEIVNSGVPFSSYIPTIVPDPGNDGIPGNSDDQALTLFNRQPSALGKDLFMLTNPPGYRASFKGFEIEVVKPLAHRWEARASFVAMHSSAPTNPGNSVFENDPGVIRNNAEVVDALATDPNTLLFATGRIFFDRGFIGKLTGFYQAPYGIRVGAVAKYYDGLPFGRLLFVEGFNQGPFFVRATPRADFGAFRTQFNSTLDMRLARDFHLRRGNISLDLDVFNLLNLNKNTREADLTSPTFAQRVPVMIQAPRIFRLGVEWEF